MATILVVDDRAANRQFLRTLLGYAGHRVVLAADGAEALACARAERPDLIVSDLVMPTMDGFELLRQLRADPALAATPVVLRTSASDDERVHALATAGGAVTVLRTPTEPDQILRTVASILGEGRGVGPAPAPLDERFDQDYRRLVADQLAQKFDELEAANRELEVFTYSASHNLRAALRTIGGLTGVLGEDYGACLGPAGADLLARVVRATERMSAILDVMLEFTELRRTPLRYERVRLDALARDALATVGEPSRGVVDIRAGHEVECHPALLRIAFAALLDNALKFSRERPHPRVDVTSEVREGEVVCCVRDNGVGFAPGSAQHIFEAFRQAHRPGRYPGHGLGLFTVRTIIERHRGRVWADSAPDRGAAVCFTLPVPSAA
jgi:signal transduction histidine kinase